MRYAMSLAVRMVVAGADTVCDRMHAENHFPPLDDVWQHDEDAVAGPCPESLENVCQAF